MVHSNHDSITVLPGRQICQVDIAILIEAYSSRIGYLDLCIVKGYAKISTRSMVVREGPIVAKFCFKGNVHIGTEQHITKVGGSPIRPGRFDLVASP